MTFDEFIRTLRRKLKEPLPGFSAQLRMTSNKRLRELMQFGTPETAIPSSVLLLLYPVCDEVCTVFIKRPLYDGVHSGQISLPGGKWEPSDSDPSQTALREAREEIGTDPQMITLIGKLTDLYIPPSNFLVSPFIGYQESRPQFTIDPEEVERTVEVKVEDLLSEENLKEVLVRGREGFEITAPAFVVRGETIWGATAMIVGEFCEILKEIKREVSR